MGDGETTTEEKKGDRHAPHARSPPTFQPWLRPRITPPTEAATKTHTTDKTGNKTDITEALAVTNTHTSLS